MSKSIKLFILTIVLSISFATSVIANPPVYIAFHWHMHQPIYWPYESLSATEARNAYSYSVKDIHRQRIGPYTTWPKDAVQMGIDNNLPYLGAQVSFSGSLIENLNDMEANGDNFVGWKNSWNYIRNQKTAGNNPRLDLVAFGYHHPLMGLIDYQDIRKQIQAHRTVITNTFQGAFYSKGIFPPENAFTPRMIPALVDEGLQWVMVDNIHFDRAAQGYPWNSGGNLYEPNPADQINPNPNDFVQLNNLWAPTKVSARWGHQPHYVQYIDPTTGTAKKIIAVPTSRYIGNEDGRGGFGALNYEAVLSQLEPYNTDPNHPILVVLHHDGDNYGGGSDGYYHSNFANFINWLKANPTRFVCTTVQDYLDRFPPDPNDIIHVEDGSWSGADNGDPEFLKWNGDPGANGYSPDRNSWGIITAAKNRVLTAEAINPNAQDTKDAWKYLMNAETSCYWYWDGTEMWDSHPARGANLAVACADRVISGGTDTVPPTIYIPQREPYNPGGYEWGIQKPSDFTIWTYVYDVSGLSSVTLKYRTDKDGFNSPSTNHNETYAGGSDVNAWVSLTMTSRSIASQTNPLPTYKANEYSVQVTGLTNVLIDYYVEAVDTRGNVGKSPIQHVKIGAGPVCTDSYESNESFTEAKSITLGSSISAKICSATDVDYFKFTTTETGSINFSMSVPSGKDFDVIMYNGSQSQIGSSTNSAGVSESITLASQPAGTYYVKVFGKSGSFDTVNPYNFSVNLITPCTDPFESNDSFAEAKSITLGSSNSAKICSATDVDYFKFTTTAVGKITLSMTVPSGKNFDVDIYNSSQTKIGTSTNGAGASESIVLTNQAIGTYYVKVYNANGVDFDQTNPYTLTVNFSQGGGSSSYASIGLPGTFNSWNIATTQMINTTGTIWERVITLSAGTYEYKFAANGTWDINWGCNNESTTLPQSGTAVRSAGNITVVIPSSGDYKVTFDDANGQWLFKSDAPCTDSYESNNSFAESKDLTLGSSISAKLCSATDVDYFKFTTSETGKITLSMTVPSGKNFDVAMYNSSQTSIGSSTNGAGVAENIILTNQPAGTYYVKVYSAGSDFDETNTYTLSVTFSTSGGTSTYTMMGIPGTFNSWNTTAVQMVNTSGTLWEKVLTLNAGTYEYKFAANGSWTVNWGSDNEGTSLPQSGTAVRNAGNIVVNVPSNGEYKITFDDANGQWTFKSNSGGGGGNSIYSSMYVPGTFNSWNPSATTAKMTNTSGTLWEITLTFTAGTYEYKFAANGNWTVNWGSDNESTTVPQSGIAVRGVGNIVVVVPSNGDYKITFDDASAKWTFSSVPAPACANDGFEANNTRDAAYGPIASAVSCSSKICSSSDADYYSFTTSGGSINITCTVPSGKDYDVYLYNSSGTKVASGTNGAGTTENFNYTASAGTYYVQVFGYNGAYDITNTYSLKVTYPVASSDNPPTVSITNPTNNATVSGTVNITANASDDKGISKVEFYVDGALKGSVTSSPYSYSWNTSGLSGTHTIYAKAFDTINQTTQSSTITVTIGGTTADSYEPNNTFAEAYTVNSGTPYSSYIYSSSDNDYYKINVTAGQTITVSMTPPSDKDYDVKLYNPSQSQVSISQNGTGVTENISYSASATGNYYIYVYGYNGAYSASVKYNLTVTLSSGTSGPTVTWGTKPKVGVSTTVTWTNSATTTHTNIHYGTNPDPRTNYSGYTTTKTGSAGTFSETISAIANNYYVVHSIMNGVDYYSTILVCPSTTGSTCSAPVASVSHQASVPKEFSLGQNYPNPFNPETVISYQLAVGSNVELKVYSITGELVRTLVNEKQRAGYYNVKWDGKDDRGMSVASGIYIYRIQAGDFTSVKKMIMAK